MNTVDPKDRKGVVVLVRITRDQAKALAALAHAEGSTRSIILRRALVKELAARARSTKRKEDPRA